MPESVVGHKVRAARHPTFIRIFRLSRIGQPMASEESGMALENDEANPCFGCGPRNPRGLRLSFHRVGDRVETMLLAGVTMEGWPGRLHSGILYTAMFETANWTVFGITGRIGMPVRTSARGRQRWVPTGRRLRIEGRAKGTGPSNLTVGLEAFPSDGQSVPNSSGISFFRTGKNSSTGWGMKK